MGLRGFLALVFLAMIGAPFSAVGQNPRPETTQSTQQLPLVQIPPAQDPAMGQNPQTPAQPAKRWTIVRVPRKAPDVKQLPDAPLDLDVYSRKIASLNDVCGGFLGDNFSVGENFTSESNKTCVPAWKVQTLIVDRPPKNAPSLKLQIDPGINLPRTASLDAICGSILSYNFSAGEHPSLESITTCTPAKTTRTLKVDHEKEREASPQLQKTDYFLPK
jgi:hypothetical protein